MTLPISGFSYNTQNFTVTRTDANQAILVPYTIILTPPPGVNPVFITRIDLSRNSATLNDQYIIDLNGTNILNHIDLEAASLTQNVLSITPFDYILLPGQNPTLTLRTNSKGDVTPVVIDVTIQYKIFNTSLQLGNDYFIYQKGYTQIIPNQTLSLLNNNSAYPYQINQILVAVDSPVTIVEDIVFNLINNAMAGDPNTGFYSGSVKYPTLSQSIILGDYLLMPGETILISNLYNQLTMFSVTINYEVLKNN